MKCPKCGSVSYAGFEQCKKCGYPLVKAAPKKSSSLLTSLFPEGVPLVSSVPVEGLPIRTDNAPRTGPELPTKQTPPPELPPANRSSSQEDRTAAERSRGDESSANWREELSERVVNFRKRRARLNPDADPAGSLEVEFEHPGKPEDMRSIFDAGAREDRDLGFDLEIGESAVTRGEDGPPREILSLEESGDEMTQLDAAAGESAQMSWDEPTGKSSPMEILVGAPAERASEEKEEPLTIIIAPLSRRFLAGLTDALVLILGAAVFGMIFWRFCGRVSPGPLNIAVLGLVGVILIFAYFGVFTAMAFATPGLLYLGCEIRNLQGGHPTVRESFWRAFGVLVSLSALMVGFLWAYVDSDRLTWHDRMSGTVITEEPRAADLTAPKAET